MLDQADIQKFIGTKPYQAHKKERLKKLSDTIRNHPAFSLSNPKEKLLFEKEYLRQKSLYYTGQIPFIKILSRIKKYSEKL